MLVLTRREGEKILIGDDIVITVVAFRKGPKIRLGIEAPKTLSVHREEVYQAIKRGEPRKAKGE